MRPGDGYDNAKTTYSEGPIRPGERGLVSPAEQTVPHGRDFYNEMQALLASRGHAMLDMRLECGMDGVQEFTMSGALGVGTGTVKAGDPVYWSDGGAFAGVAVATEPAVIEEPDVVGVRGILGATAAIKNMSEAMSRLTGTHPVPSDSSDRVAMWASVFAIAWIAAVSLAVWAGVIG